MVVELCVCPPTQSGFRTTGLEEIVRSRAPFEDNGFHRQRESAPLLMDFNGFLWAHPPHRERGITTSSFSASISSLNIANPSPPQHLVYGNRIFSSAHLSLAITFAIAFVRPRCRFDVVLLETKERCRRHAEPSGCRQAAVARNPISLRAYMFPCIKPCSARC